jgi:type IV secretion system protein VirD4
MLLLPEEDVAPAQESSSSETDVLENFTRRVYQTPGLQG